MKTIKKQGRPVNPESKRQQRLSLLELGKRGKGRPKGTFKTRPQSPEIDVGGLLKRMDDKMKEMKEIQKEISVTLKYLQIVKRK